MISLWHDYLYQPLFNLLMYLYWNNFSGFNLGVAVIYLTLLIRIVLLPLSIISERGKGFYKKLSDQVAEIGEDYANDPVKAKEETRILLQKNKIRPWAKVVVLGIQFIVIIILYQVFLGGIGAHDKLELLYSFVPQPDFVNTNFLIFDISKRSALLSAIVGIILFLEITVSQSAKKQFLSKNEVLYRFFFPFASFLVLSALPAAKSLFILTSILFSIILIMINNAFSIAFYKVKKGKK